MSVGSTPAAWRASPQFTDVFAVDSDGAAFLPALGDEPSRSEAMAGVAAALAAEGALSKWRDELYAVAPTFGAPPWFRLERAAARYFGVHTWAVHINGVVRDATEATMWLARRSADKAIDPLQLDNLVGGGIAAGTTIADTVAREAWEEAGIPRALAAQAQPAGALHIFRAQPDGLQSETIFVHDLWLPDGFRARPTRTARRSNIDASRSPRRRGSSPCPSGRDAVTADASLVILDFLLRHGAIDPASPACAGLRQLLHPQAAARRA